MRIPVGVQLRHRRDSPATATVVGVMDRDSWAAMTDNIVVADAARRTLVWVARDLWSEAVGDRVNAAYSRGGHELLLAALREHGLRVASSVVVLRSVVENTLEGLRVTVPVDRVRRYWYPLEPTRKLEDGRKLVRFEPPREDLGGERIHQWIGARQSADDPPPKLPDVDRIERQQILVRRLLEEGFTFAHALRDSALVAVSDPRALDVLASVDAGWRFGTHGRLLPATIDGKLVLLSRHAPLELRVRTSRSSRR